MYLCFRFIFSVLGDMFCTCDTWILMSIFFNIYHDFFRILSFQCKILCVSPGPIRDVATDPSQCPSSRQPRSRLWTISRCWIYTVNTYSKCSNVEEFFTSPKYNNKIYQKSFLRPENYYKSTSFCRTVINIWRATINGGGRGSREVTWPPDPT